MWAGHSASVVYMTSEEAGNDNDTGQTKEFNNSV
jgi:hypothetical protein